MTMIKKKCLNNSVQLAFLKKVVSNWTKMTSITSTNRQITSKTKETLILTQIISSEVIASNKETLDSLAERTHLPIETVENSMNINPLRHPNKSSNLCLISLRTTKMLLLG